MTSTDAGRPGGLDDDAVRESLAGLLNAPAPGEWLRRADAPAGMNVRDAAVLMLFGRGQAPRTPAGEAELDRLAELGIADIDIVLLQRAATLRHHAGQPAFPGGARDETDTSSAFTALREAEEETGLDPAGVDVIGMLPPLFVPHSRFDVTPVLAWWREPTQVAAVDSAESALAARGAIADLVAPDNRGGVPPPRRPVGAPGFHGGVMRPWGFTAGLLEWALDQLGWAREWDRTRRIHIDF